MSSEHAGNLEVHPRREHGVMLNGRPPLRHGQKPATSTATKLRVRIAH
jgi:hypothetical protein